MADAAVVAIVVAIVVIRQGSVSVIMRCGSSGLVLSIAITNGSNGGSSSVIYRSFSPLYLPLPLPDTDAAVVVGNSSSVV